MTLKRDEAIAPVPLAIEEIKMLMRLGDAHREAVTRAQMAQEMEAQYTEILRAKYGLGPEWACLSVLEGFVRFVVEEGNDGRPDN